MARVYGIQQWQMGRLTMRALRALRADHQALARASARPAAPGRAPKTIEEYAAQHAGS